MVATLIGTFTFSVGNTAAIATSKHMSQFKKNKTQSPFHTKINVINTLLPATVVELLVMHVPAVESDAEP